MNDTQQKFRGLTAAEVEESRRKHGANVLTPPERDPWWKLYLEKFDDPVIRILIIAAMIAIGVGVFETITGGAGSYAEGIGVIIAILLATTLAFLNEYKAAREFEILNQVNDDQPIKVIRDGAYETTPRRDLVVGDIVHLEVGEEIPADGAVVEAVSLEVDEARLTGESRPARKRVDAADTDDQTAYAPNFALRGTMVVDGYGLIRLTAVGDHTEIGQTARAASEQTTEQTPLNQQLEKLSKLIGVVGFGVAAGTFAALVVRGALTEEFQLSAQQWTFSLLLLLAAAVAMVRVWLPILYDARELSGKEVEMPSWLASDTLLGWLATVVAGVILFAVGAGVGYAVGVLPESPAQWLPKEAGIEFLHYFMIAVTLIVVAVPEGLAMSVTLSLAYSMRKMTAANNLVRRMHACETIGAATVICSDKTGTLTLNQMQVAETNFPCLADQKVAQPPEDEQQSLIIESISANSTANLSRQKDEPVKPLGNPTEGALLLWLDKHAVDYDKYRHQFDIVKQWTFTTERKFMAVLGNSFALEQMTLHVKGAPEIVMDRCSQIRTAGGEVQELTDAQREEIGKKLVDWQAKAMRTLAFSYRIVDSPGDDPDLDDVAQQMIWLGCVAIADPVRPEVPGAIAACHAAGVKVKVVTGDNIQTGTEIARQIGLWKEGDGEDLRITGHAFAELDDEQASEAGARIKVMARARPTDKMRLVRLLREGGEVVAVTGDGVNDAPALNHAHVGLAMGRTGTSVAKEASDIILLDDSFGSIANAILWGRSLYENIQRFVLFQLTINVAALTIALLGPFLGVKFPLTVIQMLWVNLIMDTFAALALATEPPHEAVMDRPPRDPKAFIITRDMAQAILGGGAAFAVIMIGMLLWINTSYGGFNDAEPTYIGTVFFCVFVMLQFWNLFNARTLGWGGSAFTGLFENKAFLAIAAAIFIGQFLIVTFGGEVFRTVPLDWTTWLMIIASTSLVLWVGEIYRLVKRSKEGATAS